MALPPLTTASGVRDQLNQGDSGPEDSVIDDLIDVAGSMIRDHLKRRFTVPSSREVREYRTYGRDNVYIDELLDESRVYAVTNGAGVPLFFDLDFGGEASVKGATLRVRRLSWESGYGGQRPPRQPADHADNFTRNLIDSPLSVLPSVVKVEAVFGWKSVPPPVEFAARRTVATWIEEEVTRYTEDALISRGVRFEPDELPPIVVAMLRRWDASAREAVA